MHRTSTGPSAPALLPMLMAGLFAMPVLAQQTPVDTSRDALTARTPHDTPSMLESVRVTTPRETNAPVGHTSTRLPLTARETPQSVGSVGRHVIEERAQTDLTGVLYNMQGVMTALYDPQRPLFYVRGFQVTDFQVDGLPTYNQAVNQEYDTAFYERIDIVRGANGILTGVGVPSATINMIRKRPMHDFGGSVTATLGRWNFYRLEADVNVPFTVDGSVRSRFVVAPQKQHGFHDRHKKEQLALMGIVEADLGSATTASLGYQRQNNQPVAPPWGTIPLLATDDGWINLPRSTSFSPGWTFWNRNVGTVFAEVSHQFDQDWTLKASLSRMEGTSDFLDTYAYGMGAAGPAFVDRSTGAGVTVFPWRSRSRVKQDALDIHATGKLHLGGQQHDFTVGINGLYNKEKSDTFTQASGGSYAIPNVFAWHGEMPPVHYLATGAHDDNIEQQVGLFTSARWRLGNQLSVLTGARFSNWSTRKKEYDASGTYTGSSARYEIKHEFTPYLGMVYALNPDLSLYASHGRIFNPQTLRDRNNQVLDPAVGSNTEAGIKTRLTPTLNLTAALYQTRQDNFAVLDSGVPPQSLPDGSSAYVGVDGTKARGFELALDGKAMRNLDFLAGVTYVKSSRNESDLLYANFPKWLVQVQADYRFEGELAPLSVGGGLNWQGSIDAFNVSTASGNKITLTDKSRALLDAHATWRFGEDYSVTAAITNLTDKRYWANLDYANYGEPRRYSLSFTARF